MSFIFNTKHDIALNLQANPYNKLVFAIQKHSDGRKSRLMYNCWNLHSDGSVVMSKNVTLVINIICKL